jgi:hypothetical protein
MMGNYGASGQALNLQWIEYYNDSGEEIPAFGVMRISGMRKKDGRPVIECKKPHTFGSQGRPAESRSACNDTIKIIRVSLRFHECLSTTPGAAKKVGICSRLTISRLDQGFRNNRSSMYCQVTKVKLPFHIV